MNTVGKPGRLGESIRCVVSVSMLTEGWDANTVTHILGVRAFGTQLLCEQVVGRALRRQSYDLNEEGLFNVEYADVLGIPFDFTAKPVVAPPQPPRETIQVQAVRPERDAPGDPLPARRGLPGRAARGAADRRVQRRLRAGADAGSGRARRSPRTPGSSAKSVDLTLKHLDDLRASTLLFHLTKRLLYTKWRDPGEEPKLHLFGQLKRITKQWLDTCLVCKGGTYPAQLMYQELADMACERITAAHHPRPGGRAADQGGARPLQPHRLDHARQLHHLEDQPLADRRPALPRQLGDPRQRLGGRVLPRGRGASAGAGLRQEPQPRLRGARTATAPRSRRYLPDFIVLVDDGHGDDDLLHLVVEIKGYRREDAKEKKATMETYWVPGVNNLGTYGRWAFAEFTEVYQIEADFEAKVGERGGQR